MVDVRAQQNGEHPVDSPTWKEIEGLIRQKFGLSVAEWLVDLATTLRGSTGTLPIIASHTAPKLNATLKTRDDPASLGSCLKSGQDSYDIFFSPDQSSEQLNFTIAHECGHIILDRLSIGLSVTGEDVELFCDLFALFLLAPVSFLDEYLTDDRLDLSTIDNLSGMLRVPLDKLKLLIADLFPVAFISWKGNNGIQYVGDIDLTMFEEEICRIVSSAETHGEYVPIESSDLIVKTLRKTSDGGRGLVVTEPQGRSSESAISIAKRMKRRCVVEQQPGSWVARSR